MTGTMPHESEGRGIVRPNIARVCNRMLGGKDNYPTDADVVVELEKSAPGQQAAAWASRKFQQRVLRYLADTVGVRQFLDLGAGLLVPEVRRVNTHEIVDFAPRIAPADRPIVVYIDSDPVCVAHGRALLAATEQTHYLPGDLTDPGLLHDPAVSTYLDLRQPICVLLCGVLHHVTDSLEPARVVSGWIEVLPPGSFLVLTHLFDPGPADSLHEYAMLCQSRYSATLGSGWFRTREQITGFFDGLQMVTPGLVQPGDWWPCGPPVQPRSVAERLVLAGVGSKACAWGTGLREDCAVSSVLRPAISPAMVGRTSTTTLTQDSDRYRSVAPCTPVHSKQGKGPGKMGNDLFDKAAQTDPAWLDFARSNRITAQVDRLFTETLPTVPTGPAGWKSYAGNAVPPMPQVDRYSDDMTLQWLADVFEYFLPEADTVIDNPDLADQWVCYIGEYFVRHCGGKWINAPRIADGMLYKFGPAIAYDWTDALDMPVDVLYSAVEEQDFTVVNDQWYDRTVEYAEVHGLPHEAIEHRQSHDG
ncbi:SAM-dependent methyltransferase [Nocardia carnea]|uniref:SAM-dependent methyltransferase n=1 Tax=Nocardia carnea TaxID=37328 RepID=UPI002454F084|nr:SAM-dependent methyltransferase [Nocardia carnea]